MEGWRQDIYLAKVSPAHGFSVYYTLGAAPPTSLESSDVDFHSTSCVLLPAPQFVAQPLLSSCPLLILRTMTLAKWGQGYSRRGGRIDRRSVSSPTPQQWRVPFEVGLPASRVEG